MNIQTLPPEAHWNLFKVEGRLDAATALTVQRALEHAADIDQGDLIVDLEELTDADEFGVNRLAATIARLCAGRPSLHIALVAGDERLQALTRASFPTSVMMFRSGSEALRAIGLSAAA
jgi:hypothetical protein